MGNNYAEPMEKFFMGLEGPSFSQLEDIAKYMNISKLTVKRTAHN